jgi:hypothetical protein
LLGLDFDEHVLLVRNRPETVIGFPIKRFEELRLGIEPRGETA